MPSWIPIIVMLVALIGFLWWLPLAFALIAGILIVFLIFLELYLAGVKGRHILALWASQKGSEGNQRPQDSPRGTSSKILWLGLVAKSTEWQDGSPSHRVLGGSNGFEAGPGDGGGDGGVDV